MEETTKLFMDFGFLGVIMIVILYLMLKYIPQYLDHLFERIKKRDYRDDLLMETIKNNTSVIDNNSLVIKAATDKSDNLDTTLKEFIDNFKRHDSRAEVILQDIKIVKHNMKGSE